MPKAVDKAITNRRSFLSVLATVPAAAIANGTAATLAAATEPDPIFAAIETHRAAYVVFEAAEREHPRSCNTSKPRTAGRASP